jgi:hypothetical protein
MTVNASRVAVKLQIQDHVSLLKMYELWRRARKSKDIGDNERNYTYVTSRVCLIKCVRFTVFARENIKRKGIVVQADG